MFLVRTLYLRHTVSSSIITSIWGFGWLTNLDYFGVRSSWKSHPNNYVRTVLCLKQTNKQKFCSYELWKPVATENLIFCFILYWKDCSSVLYSKIMLKMKQSYSSSSWNVTFWNLKPMLAFFFFLFFFRNSWEWELCGRDYHSFSSWIIFY